MGKTLLEATVKDIKKCRYPSKYYVYVLEVTWSEGTSTIIYRRYTDFFEFQCGLLEKFPDEAGTKDPSDRIIPFLPGKKLLGRSQVRSVAEKRRDKLNDYCKALVRLPSKISDDVFVHNFFEVRVEDLQDPSKVEKEKAGKVTSTSPVGEEISGPMVLERYVAIADYEKQKKNECSLTAGQMVEVIDKNQNGWWFVSLDNFNEGWVPATYLDPLYGTEEAHVEVFSPGQEQYITTSGYHAQNPDELSFEKGVIVDVIVKGLDGWWTIRYKEKEGLAPAAYLSRYTSPHGVGASPAELVESVRDAVQQASGTKLSWKPSARVDVQEPIYAPTPRKASVKRKIQRREAPPKPTPFAAGGSSGHTSQPVDEPCPVYEVIPEPEEEVYTTLADFQAPTTGDGLTFSAGCSVTVVTKNASGWWYVEMGDKEGWVPSSYLERASPKTESLAVPPPQLPPKSSPVQKRKPPLASKNTALRRSTSEEALKNSQPKPSPTRTRRVDSPPSKPTLSSPSSSSSWMTKSTPFLPSSQEPSRKPAISLAPQTGSKTAGRGGGVKSHTPVGRSSSSDVHGRSKPHLAPRPQQSVASLTVPKPHTLSHSTSDRGTSTGGGETVNGQPVSELARILQKRQAASSTERGKPLSPRATPKTTTPSLATPKTTTSPSIKRLDMTVKQQPQRPKPYSGSGVAGKRVPPKRPEPPKASAVAQAKKTPPPRPTTSPGQARKSSVSYTAVCEYSGGEGQMVLQKGQKVEVLEKTSDGWWYVKAGSEEGWAPSSFLEEGKPKPGRPANGPSHPKIEQPVGRPSKPSPASRPVPKPRRSTHIANTYRAAASYQVPVYEDSGMELVEGQTYEVLEKQGGWWFVTDGQKEGWAPASYLDPA